MDPSRPPQIIFSVACVSIETHKLSAGPVNIGASEPFNNQKNSQTLRYSKFKLQIWPTNFAQLGG